MQRKAVSINECCQFTYINSLLQEQAAKDAAKPSEPQIPLEDRLSEADKLLKDLGISMLIKCITWNLSHLVCNLSNC